MLVIHQGEGHFSQHDPLAIAQQQGRFTLFIQVVQRGQLQADVLTIFVLCAA
ncbi:hypothetical protein D3C72_2279680 [compost metagenome]